MLNELSMSTLPKTWILDLDGTIVKHNGYKIDGKDSLLPGISDFLQSIRAEDMVIFVTSRSTKYAKRTEKFLRENDIHFDHIIYDAPYGERILVNDCKSSGLKTAYAINTFRDQKVDLRLIMDESL